MKKLFQLVKKFAVSMSKFALFSLVATLVDFCLFSFVLSPIMEPFKAELISGFVGMCTNFYFQKNFVFQNKRNNYAAFALSITFSLIALLLGAFLISFLVDDVFQGKYIMLAKLISIGFKFLFNYFTKKWVFERTVK
ncbi:MAG: GtrA family protein [Crocinitomicaceae bacterium]